MIRQKKKSALKVALLLPQHEDEDVTSISVISSVSDFEVGSLPFKRRTQVCVLKLYTLLYFKPWFVN